MHHIHFHESFYNDICLGKKTQTARIDEARYPLGKTIANFSDGLSLPIEITGIKFKTINEMSLSEIEKDGFSSRADLWEALRVFYPNLKEEDDLMLVEFRCIMNN